MSEARLPEKIDAAADDLTELFEAGSWDQLEAVLRQSVAQDVGNARLTFRLANLLTLRGKCNEAQPYYEKSWLQKWPGALCLNNRGVSLIWGGEARAGLTSLMEARNEEPRLGPPSYNLAIVLDSLADAGGPLPSLVRAACGDLWGNDPEGGADSEPEEPPANDTRTAEPIDARREAIKCFRAAGLGFWPNYGLLEAPLLLWHSELPTGFGYELLREVTDVDAAQEQFDAGAEHIKANRWQDGLDCLARAAKLLPSMEARIIPWRTRALVALCREYRALVRVRQSNHDFEGARNALNALLALLPQIPDQELVTEILIAEINEYGESLRHRQPADDWQALQSTVAAVWHCLERYRQRAASGAPEAGNGASTPREPSAVESYLAQLCWDAWSQQIQHFIIKGEYGTALGLLERSETFWFAKDHLPHWRWSVYTAICERHYANGTVALQGNDLAGAARCFADALAAAKEADNKELINSCESQLTRLARTRAQRQHADIQAKIDAEQYEDAAQSCREEIDQHPDDTSLRQLLDTALRHLLLQAEEAARAERWDLITAKVETVLRHRPNEQHAQDLLARARAGTAEILLARAHNEYTKRNLAEARRLCEEILAIDPRHPVALNLKRTLDIFEAADWQAAFSNYDQAYQRFCAALATRQFRGAFTAAVELYESDPTNELTTAACDWAFPCLVEDQRRKLHRDPGAAASEAFIEHLDRLLLIRPTFAPALDLRVEVARVQSTIDPARSEQAENVLADAREALTNRDPEKSLECVATVLELGDPKHALAAHGIRAHALEMAATMATHQIRDPSEASLASAEHLIDLLSKWQHAEAARLREELNQRRYRRTLRDRGKDPDLDRNKELGDLLQRIDELIERPRAALDELHRGTRRLLARFPQTPNEQVDTLRALHRRLLELPDSRFGRWRLRRWDQRHCVPALCAAPEGR
jgi:tetratricopeptide (TPR) repeat protein